ncbi:MAG: aspartate kinase, partial [Spirochaetes bacterium]|nr:aspartate kinase [Spirochaetota bacterium]
MAVLVQKYGGTSVGSIERIKKVAKRIIKSKKEGYQVVVVVSAMSGVTDRLTSLAHKISKEPHIREMDMLLSTGEQVSISLLA